MKKLLARFAAIAFVLASLNEGAFAQAEQKDPAAEVKVVETPSLIVAPKSDITLTLAECLAIGADRQPAIRAAVASLQSSQSGYQALLNLGPVARVASPDLEFRKKQGQAGLVVSEADVQKAIQESKYDIIRLYYTFVYARQQDVNASEAVTQLEIYYGVAEGLSKLAAPKVTLFDLYVMEESINEVRKSRDRARSGQSAALAALKEAMGVEATMSFVPRDLELPVMGGTVTEEQVVSLAVSRRPEMAMAAAGVDAFRLEICSQAAIRFRLRIPTLAAGSDLHSRILPVPHRNGEYRPGALAPEMPTLMVGKRDDRIVRATDISNRQEILFDKTRDLVTLEAANSYHQWASATERIQQAKLRFDRSKDIAKKAKDVGMDTRDQQFLIRFQVLEVKAQSDYLEAVYEHIKALATLERVTAGGVKPAFPMGDAK